MSFDNDNSRRVYKEVEADFKIPLVIPSHILADINYLHYMVGPTEWSGILVFSETKGSIDDLENLELRVEGIYPMDIGSSAYTEFDYETSIIDVYDQFEMLNDEGKMTKRIGTIHTHHNMKVFFSGTDTGELHTNADKHLYYLSLIVNFSGAYQAKIAILAEEENNIEYRGKSLYNKKSKQSLFLIDCEVLVETKATFADRISELQERKKTRIQKLAKVQGELVKVQGGKMFPADYNFPIAKKPIPIHNKDGKVTLTNWEAQKILGALVSQDESNDKGLYTAIQDVTRDLKGLDKDTRKTELAELAYFIETYFDAVLDEQLGFTVFDDNLPEIIEQCLDTLNTTTANDPYKLIQILKNGLQSYRLTGQI